MSHCLPFRLAGLLGLVLVAVSCEDLVPPPVESVPAALEAVGPLEWTGEVGTALDEPLAVRVTDDAGAPVPDVAVNWSVLNGEGAELSPLDDRTGSDGVARATWRLGTDAGPQQARAAAASLDPLTFTADAEPGPLDTLWLSADTLAFQALHDSLALETGAADRYGNQIADHQVTWSAQDTMVAGVTAAGVVYARGNGTTAVMAASDGRVASAAAVVRQVPASVVITAPDTLLEALGDSLELGADVADANAFAIPDPRVSWSIADSAVLGLVAAGVVEARGAGAADVVATADAVADTIRLTVVAVVASVTIAPDSLVFEALGDTLDIEAAAYDRNGHELETALAWTVLDTTIAALADSGLVARAAGSTSLIASAGAVTDTAHVRVAPVPAALALEPDTLRFTALGDTVDAGATVRDANGNVLAEPVDWAVADTAVARVDAAGRVVAAAGGTSTLTASVSADGLVMDSAVIEVVQTVTSVAVTPAADTVRVDSVTSFSATAADANGAPVPGAAVAWSSTDTAVARVDSVGGVMALAEGSAGILAAAADAVDTATIVVLPAPNEPPVVSITAPADSSVHAEGDTIRFSGTAQDPEDGPLSGASVVWTSSLDGEIGTDTAFASADLSPGEHVVRVTATDSRDISASDSVDITITVHVVLTWAAISPGGSHTCGVTTEGAAYCWGYNFEGQLGDGTTTRSTTPTLVSGGHDWVAISSNYQTCGVTTDGNAYCWGRNTYGELGDSTTTDRNTPTLVSGLHDWAAISAGNGHTCGVTTDGDAYCWGSNGAGQLGDSTTTDSSTPTLVAGGHQWATISAGASHTCGVTTDRAAYCWGYNNKGQLGDGTATDRSTPTPVSGGHHWAAVGAGSNHTCGVTTFGAAYCWGWNYYGQLGDGTTLTRSIPTLVSDGHDWAAILEASRRHTCGVTTEGAAYCWGDNGEGRLGSAAGGGSRTPTLVLGGHDWAATSVGRSHTCGVTMDGVAYCWGYNGSGQLGDGTTTNRGTPTLVTGPSG